MFQIEEVKQWFSAGYHSPKVFWKLVEVWLGCRQSTPQPSKLKKQFTSYRASKCALPQAYAGSGKGSPESTVEGGGEVRVLAFGIFPPSKGSVVAKFSCLRLQDSLRSVNCYFCSETPSLTPPEPQLSLIAARACLYLPGLSLHPPPSTPSVSCWGTCW